jgi:hypothetical protein
MAIPVVGDVAGPNMIPIYCYALSLMIESVCVLFNVRDATEDPGKKAMRP